MADISEFSMEFFSLKGKNAVVTGGNTGLGRAFSTALAKAGANIFVPGLADDGGVTQGVVEGEGVQYLYMKADLTKPGISREIVQNCVEHFGSLDILVNSAGMIKLADVRDFDRSMWDPMIELNLTCAFDLSHEAALHMIPRGSGKIINICSLFSYLGGLGSPAYTAMKHGLAGLTKAYADELGKYGIQVNGLAPGYFATDITKGAQENPEASRRIVEHIPMGRWGETIDLMGAVIYLASHASDYVNGHLLVVDGGYLVR